MRCSFAHAYKIHHRWISASCFLVYSIIYMPFFNAVNNFFYLTISFLSLSLFVKQTFYKKKKEIQILIKAFYNFNKCRSGGGIRACYQFCHVFVPFFFFFRSDCSRTAEISFKMYRLRVIICRVYIPKCPKRRTRTEERGLISRRTLWWFFFFLLLSVFLQIKQANVLKLNF